MRNNNTLWTTDGLGGREALFGKGSGGNISDRMMGEGIDSGDRQRRELESAIVLVFIVGACSWRCRLSTIRKNKNKGRGVCGSRGHLGIKLGWWWQQQSKLAERAQWGRDECRIHR